MFFTARKTEARLRELAPLRYRDAQPRNDWRQTPSAGTEAVGERPPAGEGTPFAIDQEWGGDDAWCWLFTRVSVPQSCISHPNTGRPANSVRRDRDPNSGP